MSDKDEIRMLELVIEALACLVRDEYPSHLSLVEIAETWGNGITNEHIEALRQYEDRGASSAVEDR